MALKPGQHCDIPLMDLERPRVVLPRRGVLYRSGVSSRLTSAMPCRSAAATAVWISTVAITTETATAAAARIPSIPSGHKAPGPCTWP